MNDEDSAWQDYLAQQAEERNGHEAIVKKWKKAVDAIEGKVKDLRKTLSTRRADLRYAIDGLQKLEQKIKDMELTGQDPAKVDVARTNLKKNRLAQMRLAREVEDLEIRVSNALTPEPGQPGSAGILAHKRLLEMEDEEEARKLEHEQRMAELDQAIASKEEQVKAAEDYLDQALFLLGEDVYARRIPDAQLAAFYPRLDRAQ
jgi:chromosome segregation ATPase